MGYREGRDRVMPPRARECPQPPAAGRSGAGFCPRISADGPADTLTLVQPDAFRTSDLQNPNRVVLFQATKGVAVCHSGCRKLTRGLYPVFLCLAHEQKAEHTRTGESRCARQNGVRGGTDHAPPREGRLPRLQKEGRGPGEGEPREQGPGFDGGSPGAHPRTLATPPGLRAGPSPSSWAGGVAAPGGRPASSGRLCSPWRSSSRSPGLLTVERLPTPGSVSSFPAGCSQQPAYLSQRHRVPRVSGPRQSQSSASPPSPWPPDRKSVV